MISPPLSEDQEILEKRVRFRSGVLFHPSTCCAAASDENEEEKVREMKNGPENVRKRGRKMCARFPVIPCPRKKRSSTEIENVGYAGYE